MTDTLKAKTRAGYEDYVQPTQRSRPMTVEYLIETAAIVKDSYTWAPAVLELAAENAALKAQLAERAGILIDRDARLRQELRSYLDGLAIHGDNIGIIRSSLFMPWNSEWNGWVREETAERERSASDERGDIVQACPECGANKKQHRHSEREPNWEFWCELCDECYDEPAFYQRVTNPDR